MSMRPSSKVDDDLPVIRINHLNHWYGDHEFRTQVLYDANLEIGRGQVVILRGPSGSGRATLMELIGGRRAVQDGYLRVMGHTMNGLSHRQLLEVRRQIGFIFEDPVLIASLTVAENVAVGLRYKGLSVQQRRQRVEEVLNRLGLQHRHSHSAEWMSGGQKRLVAIARAMVHSPQLILANEPTAQLSPDSARQVIEMIGRLAREEGCTSLIMTYDNRILDVANSVLTIEDGRIVSQQQPDTSTASVLPLVAERPVETSKDSGSTPAAPRSPKIFISYRREESEDITARIHDRLIARFGKENVFLDIDNIPLGVDFWEHIDRAVRQCDVLLAVVGEQWLGVRYREGPRQGQRRLDDEGDYVRFEIQSALARGIPVIPVRIGAAKIPAAHDLPDGLQKLANRNAAEVRSGPDFNHHVERLIQGIQNLTSTP